MKRLGKQRAPFRTWLRPAHLLLLNLAVAAAPPRAAAVAPTLSTLLHRARVVAAAVVADVTAYDGGNVTVASLQAERVFKGAPDNRQILVVEMRNVLEQPAALEAGVQVVVFLRQAPMNSYLRRVLPRADYFRLLPDRVSCLKANDPAEAAELIAVVQELAAASRNPERDPDKRAEKTRQLTFKLVSARHPELVRDGARSLAEVHGLHANLSPAEREQLAKALARDDLPDSVRTELIRGVATARLKQLVPSLRNVHTPQLLAETWRALRQLDAAPEQEIENGLADPNAVVRATAAREWGAGKGEAGIDRLAALATADPSELVRLAAIESLGETRSPRALEGLEHAFRDSSWEVRRAAARAISAIGGRSAAESLARLAFDAPPDAQPYAVLMLMMSGVTRGDPLLLRIQKEHPDPKVRDLAEHGLRSSDQ